MPARVDSKKATLIMKRAGLKPLEPYVDSKKPWKSKHLKCGRIVSPTYNSIQRGQGGCIFCAGLAVDPKDAKKLFISKGLKPIEPYPGQNKLPWKSIHLQCGREVSPSYNLIQQNYSIGCHFCSDQFVDPDEAYQFFLSKDLQPLVPYPGTAKPWKSIHLICGSEIKPRYGHIKAGRKGCPVCAGVVPITQEKAFAFFRSNGMEPKEKFKGPHNPWKSIHTVCGREVSPRWASVQQGQSGCAYCSGNKVDIKDVKRVLKENNLKLVGKFTNTSKPLVSIHIPCGNKVAPSYSALRIGQGPCEFCGKNMVSEAEALELLRKNGFKPLEVFPGGSKPWKCLHKKCGNQIEVITTYLRRGGKGCNICAGLAPISSNDAKKLFLSKGFTPLVKFQGSKIPWKSKHNVCGKIVSPTWGSLKAGRGCKYCQIGGINLLAPAYLYLITHTSLNSHKIGIGGFDSAMDRLDKHIKQGWKTYNKIDLNTAEEAYEIEQSVLNWLRSDLDLQQYLLSEQMPQRGHTETVDASEIDLPTIWAKVEELSRKRFTRK
jgi:recombinational DNA repair protein (RecF pathway)